MPDATVTMRAPAKANLFLRVLARESTGYHGIETLFCLLDLADELTAERRDGGETTIEVLGADVGPAADNLAVRAAEMVLHATGRKFGVHLTLEKRIPMQAGLGGGSSDAAAALIADQPTGRQRRAPSRAPPVCRPARERCPLLPERGPARSRLGAR